MASHSKLFIAFNVNQLTLGHNFEKTAFYLCQIITIVTKVLLVICNKTICVHSSLVLNNESAAKCVCPHKYFEP